MKLYFITNVFRCANRKPTNFNNQRKYIKELTSDPETKMNPKVVIVGSCIIDFISYSSRFPQPGETIHGHHFSQGFGGKGANQCIASAKIGGHTGMVGRLGDDIFGKQYLENFQKNSVNTEHLKLTENTSTGIAQIIVSDNGQNQIVIVAEANKHLSKEDVQEAKNMIDSALVLVFQCEVPIETTLEALRMKSQTKGITLVNAAPALPDIPKEIYGLTDIFCVNETEASALTNLEVNDVNSSYPAIKKLIEFGCKNVIITLGENGAVFGSQNKDNYDHIPIEDKVTPIDTTGAGDMFVGALAYYLAYHPELSIKEQIRRSCKLATLSVLKEGTQSSFPTRDELPDNLFL